MDTRIAIREDADLVMARKHIREVASGIGMRPSDAEALVTAATEIATNILVHAGSGDVTVSRLDQTRLGIEVVARDQGPGIGDVEQALEDGYSTAGGLGLGLAGARRLVDDFELLTQPGRGTTITMKKWVR